MCNDLLLPILEETQTTICQSLGQVGFMEEISTAIHVLCLEESHKCIVQIHSVSETGLEDSCMFMGEVA